MRKKMQLLEQLQRIDLKVDELQGEKRTLLADISSLEQKHDESRRRLAEKQGRLDELDGEKRALEEGFAAEAENIKRAEARQKEIKTQKEYQAVSKEVSAAKKQQTELEEQILQKLADIEELRKEIAEMEAQLQAYEQNVASQKGEVSGKIARIDEAIAGDETSRDSVARSLPDSLLRKYSMLREKRQGVAIVEAREGSCLGCNMNLPPQVYNSLFRLDDLVTCPHCQRVLFVRQANEGNGE